jgi:hypothetical protein
MVLKYKDSLTSPIIFKTVYLFLKNVFTNKDSCVPTGTTVQFLYLETCGIRKCGKMHEKRGAGHEAST